MVARLTPDQVVAFSSHVGIKMNAKIISERLLSKVYKFLIHHSKDI